MRNSLLEVRGKYIKNITHLFLKIKELTAIGKGSSYSTILTPILPLFKPQANMQQSGGMEKKKIK